MRVAIKTLGCKSNRYESDKLFDSLKGRHEVFELNEGAYGFRDSFDILIVNTCTVTHSADRKSRQAIRSLKRANPDCKVIVFGCGANISGEDYEKMEEVDFVVQSTEKVFELINKNEKKDKDINSLKGSRTRALVKIQDGCDNYCTYCIIPFARGPAYSFSSKRILGEVLQKEAEGFKEIVLTGINIGEWEEDGISLADLFAMLIEKTKNVRFRVSSIEPKNFSGKFFELFKTGRFCPHIHMSLQSGSDGILKKMRRNYDTAFYFEICEKFREVVPDIGLTTDVIVGFPGETDKEFEETCEFVKKVGFLKVHVFPYSKRKGTIAYRMKDQISEDVKKSRAKKLRAICEESGMAFKERLLGKKYDVLVENFNEGRCTGYTANYIPVRFSCTEERALVNELTKVELGKLCEDGVIEADLKRPT